MSGVPVQLVTGFPARRARYVVRELLRAEPSSRVALIVRPERENEARALLAEAELAGANAEVTLGDPTAIDFGLSGAHYLELARSVQVVHAAYSITDAMADEKVAERVNVGAARELCEFSRASRSLARIVFYSSVFVSGQRSGLIHENELEASQSFRSGVERSLAVAERMLSHQRTPRVVLRAGHLLSAEPPLASDLGSAPLLLMAFVANAPTDAPLPRLPRADAALPITPVEYLARFGVYAGRHVKEDSTYHVIDPEQLSLGDFYELVVRQCGRALDAGFNPSALTRVLIGNPALRLIPQHLRRILEALTSSARYATDGASARSAGGGPACPPLGSYVEHLLEQVRDPQRHETLFSARPNQAEFLID